MNETEKLKVIVEAMEAQQKEQEKTIEQLEEKIGKLETGQMKLSANLYNLHEHINKNDGNINAKELKEIIYSISRMKTYYSTSADDDY